MRDLQDRIVRIRQSNEGCEDGGGQATYKPGRENQDGRTGEHTNQKTMQEQRLHKSHEPTGQRNRFGNHSQFPGGFGARKAGKGDI